MKIPRLRRPSPAFVISLVALTAAIGGGAAIALPGQGTVKRNDLAESAVAGKSVKNESLKGKDIKDGRISGADIRDESLSGDDVANDSLGGDDVDEGSLGQVPSAASADNATTADDVATVRPFSAGADEDSVVSLVRTPEFELMGVCDANGDFAIPVSTAVFDYVGSQTLGSTTFFIVNRGAAPAFGDSDDDEDFKLETDEAIAFNYDDPGDGGEAFTPDGHMMNVPGWSNLNFDTGDVNSPDADDDPTGFPNDCHFSGAALVN